MRRVFNATKGLGVVMSSPEVVLELMRRTGEGKLACTIALQLTGWDPTKALERMRVSYPDMKEKDL